MFEDWEKSAVKVTRETRISCLVERLHVITYCGAVAMYYPSSMIVYFTDIPENRQFALKTSYPPFAYRSPFYELITCLHTAQGVIICMADMVPLIMIIASVNYLIIVQAFIHTIKFIYSIFISRLVILVYRQIF